MDRRSLKYYVAAAVLMAVFIQTFEVWRALAAGPAGGRAWLVPVGAFAVMAVAIGLWAARRTKQGKKTRFWALAAALIIASGALFLSDPAFPAKRVHVPEYLVLALILRKAASYHVEGRGLLVYTVLLALLLGMHDELIQGLHPDRTYGVMDMVVNGAAGLAGALVGHGLGLFNGSSPAVPPPQDRPGDILRPLFVTGGVVLLLGALPAFRDGFIPWWTMLPLLAAGFVWFLLRDGSPQRFPPLHPRSVSVWLALSTAIYPVLANVTPLHFH